MSPTLFFAEESEFLGPVAQKFSLTRQKSTFSVGCQKTSPSKMSYSPRKHHSKKGFRLEKKIRRLGILGYFLTRNPNFQVPFFKTSVKMVKNRLFFRKKFSQKNQFLSQFCLIFRRGDLKIRIPRQKIAQYRWSSYGFLGPKTTF